MADKHYCWGIDCKNEIPEPITCCSGRDCGCMGQPSEPPFCSDDCYQRWMAETKRVNKVIINVK